MQNISYFIHKTINFAFFRKKNYKIFGHIKKKQYFCTLFRLIARSAVPSYNG